MKYSLKCHKDGIKSEKLKKRVQNETGTCLISETVSDNPVLTCLRNHNSLAQAVKAACVLGSASTVAFHLFGTKFSYFLNMGNDDYVFRHETHVFP